MMYDAELRANRLLAAMASGQEELKRQLVKALTEAYEQGRSNKSADQEEKIRRQAGHIGEMRVALEQKNRALDALHYVWCTGGCETGVHRYEHAAPLTEELLEVAAKNVERMALRIRNRATRGKAT